mgnify:CR=1 FL=1
MNCCLLFFLKIFVGIIALICSFIIYQNILHMVSHIRYSLGSYISENKRTIIHFFSNCKLLRAIHKSIFKFNKNQKTFSIIKKCVI